MIALLQRVSAGRVSIEGAVVAEIGAGLLVMIAIVKGDDTSAAQRMIERVLNYRVFADEAGRMNRSLREVQGDLLLVPQFTLAADTDHGNRPGFSLAAEPPLAAALFNYVLEQARAQHASVGAGRFGANMQVSLVNDGPVTFWLESSRQ